MRQFLAIASLLVLSQTPNSRSATCDFYVSSSGSDTNPGNKAAPFRTIEGARNFLRSLPREGMDVTVWIETGEYFLPSTIEFDERDGGLVGGSVTYRSEEGGEVTLSGGTRVTGWQPAEGNLEGSLGPLRQAPLTLRQRDPCPHGQREGVCRTWRGVQGDRRAGPWAWDTGSKPDRSIYTDIPMIRRNPEDVEITNFQLWNCNTVCVREVLQESNKVILVHQEPYGAIAQTCHWDNFDAGAATRWPTPMSSSRSRDSSISTGPPRRSTTSRVRGRT